jgi:hypothetical protein
MSVIQLACEYFGYTEAQIVGMRTEPDGTVTLSLRGGGERTFISPPPAPLDELKTALDIDATAGALDLAKQEGINLGELYKGQRLTLRDVQAYLKERQHGDD